MKIFVVDVFLLVKHSACLSLFAAKEKMKQLLIKNYPERTFNWDKERWTKDRSGNWIYTPLLSSPLGRIHECELEIPKELERYIGAIDQLVGGDPITRDIFEDLLR